MADKLCVMQRQKLSRIGFGSVICAAVLVGAGCSRDVRLAGKNVPTVAVAAVSHYGLALDKDASPEQVAFVALRAIRDDFFAEDDDARQKALDVEFSVSAAGVMQSRNRTSLTRDEFVYSIVHRWTPTVSHYAGDFELDWESAQPRLHRREVTHLGKPPEDANAVEECEVAMVVKSPNGNPNSSVVMLVWLAKDEGLWRVTHLGFDVSARSIPGQ